MPTARYAIALLVLEVRSFFSSLSSLSSHSIALSRMATLREGLRLSLVRSLRLKQYKQKENRQT